MPNDIDLTQRLEQVLLETAAAFLRLVQEQHPHADGAEYEIALAVRRRRLRAPASG